MHPSPPQQSTSWIQESINKAQDEWELLLQSSHLDSPSSRKGEKKIVQARPKSKSRSKSNKPSQSHLGWSKNEKNHHAGQLREFRNALPKDLQHGSNKVTPESAFNSTGGNNIKIRRTDGPQQTDAAEYDHHVASMQQLRNYPKARIIDLCDEEKSKITKLIQQLVKIGSEHDRMLKSFGAEKDDMNQRLNQIRSQNREFVDEAIEMKNKLNHSLEMLRTYQKKLITLQKERDHEQNLRLELEKTCRSTQNELERVETKMSKLKSDLKMKEVHQKYEFESQLKTVQKDLQDVNEKLRLERKERLHHQNVSRLEQHQASSILAPTIATETRASSSPCHEPKAKEETLVLDREETFTVKQVKDILQEAWTDRISKALQQSTAAKVSVESSPPKVRASSKNSTFSSGNDKILAPTLSFDEMIEKSPPMLSNEQTNAILQRVISVKQSPVREKNQDRTHTQGQAFIFDERQTTNAHPPSSFLPSSSSSSMSMLKDGSTYHEMSLFDIVDSLESEGSMPSGLKANPATSALNQSTSTHFKRSSLSSVLAPSPHSLSCSSSPLSRASASVERAVELDMQNFIQKHEKVLSL